jgi:hypothetical protein
LVLPTSEVDLGYLTALVDREGIIALATCGDYWRVRVIDTSKEIIDWLATVGGTTSSHAWGRNRKVMWEWNLADQEEVHALLSAVLPHLKNPAKREEARKAMDDLYEGARRWGRDAADR